MLFWILALIASLLFVIFIAAPMIAGARAATANADSGLGVWRGGALVMLAAAPVGAFALYMAIGAPQSLSPEFHEALEAQMTDPAAALAALPPEERAAAIEGMVAGLAAGLEAEPDNPEGWRMLARSYAVMGRTEDSVQAYRELVARTDPPVPADWRNYASALISASPPDAAFGEELLSALNRLVELNENDPLALFYLGLNAQEGDRHKEALEYWRRLLAVVPEDAPILPQLEALIAEAAAAAAENDG